MQGTPWTRRIDIDMVSAQKYKPAVVLSGLKGFMGFGGCRPWFGFDYKVFVFRVLGFTEVVVLSITKHQHIII